MTVTLLPPSSATEPPEARGLRRDEVRLLVASPAGVQHRRFRDLPEVLTPGDVLVVNVSATLPAAVDGRRPGGATVVAHFSGPVAGDEAAWVVELREPDNAGPVLDGAVGETLDLAGGGRIRLRHPISGPIAGTRLWEADVRTPGSTIPWLTQHGRPIRYRYVPDAWPLDTYQTVFSQQPGSAEMPSAARPFTPELVVDLIARGIVIAPVLLHTGVSSPETGEPPQPERFEVTGATAGLIEDARRRGGRIIGVGTTAVRAVESAVDALGAVQHRAGWTDLVLGPDRPARVVDGLVTGWHEEGASHLELLRAVVGAGLVEDAYREAHQHGYAWHEFGDSCLLLP